MTHCAHDMQHHSAPEVGFFGTSPCCSPSCPLLACLAVFPFPALFSLGCSFNFYRPDAHIGPRSPEQGHHGIPRLLFDLSQNILET
eukprot:5448681-Amphidinium_carterae.1